MNKLAPCLSLFFFALFLVLGQKILGDADTLWHVKTGEGIVKTLTFPTTDNLSFSMEGKPWIAKEWLSQVLLYLGSLGGFTALLIGICLLLASIIYLLTKEIARHFSETITLILVLVVISFSLSTFNARPHLLALLPLIILTIGLLRANEKQEAPSFWLLLPFLAWVNLHGSFLIGFVIIGFFGLEALLQNPKTFKAYFLFGLSAFLISFINPYGWRVYEAAFAVLNLGEAKFLITEWMKPRYAPPLWGEGLIFITLLGLAYKFKFPLLRAIFICFFVHLAFSAARHSAIAIIMIVLLSLKPLSHLNHSQAEKFKLPLMTLSLVAAAMLIFTLFKGGEPAHSVYPKQAIAALKLEKNARILNHYNFGGAMIYEGVKTFIDGRTEFYGASFFIDYHKALVLEDETVFNRIVSEYKINTLFLPIGFKELVHVKNANWRLIYQVEIALIYSEYRMN